MPVAGMGLGVWDPRPRSVPFWPNSQRSSLIYILLREQKVLLTDGRLGSASSNPYNTWLQREYSPDNCVKTTKRNKWLCLVLWSTHDLQNFLEKKTSFWTLGKSPLFPFHKLLRKIDSISQETKLKAYQGKQMNVFFNLIPNL